MLMNYNLAMLKCGKILTQNQVLNVRLIGHCFQKLGGERRLSNFSRFRLKAETIKSQTTSRPRFHSNVVVVLDFKIFS